MKPSNFIILAMLSATAVALTWVAPRQTDGPPQRRAAPVAEGEGHAWMVSRLAQLRQATTFPDDFTRNRQASVYFQQQAQAAASQMESLREGIAELLSEASDSSQQQLVSKLDRELATLKSQREAYLGKFIFHTMVAGDPQRALAELDALVDDRPILAGERPPDFAGLSEWFELKGTIHFVIGEQRNCQQNHNARSCILPFHPDAFHIDPAGAEAAIRYLRLALEADPANPAARWLYNLAFMALGQYPSAVPQSLRVPFDKYDADLEFPRFPDKASSLGINTKGYLGGAIMEDFNGDGWLDLFTTSFKLEDNVRLYFNRGPGGFEDVTEQAGLTGITGGANAIQADYNNDGHCDIFVMRGGWLGAGGCQPNSLLRNNGDGTFTDVTRSARMHSEHPTHTAAWADVNKDGHLDLFVGNESGAFEEHESGKTVVAAESPDHFSELFINNQDGTFSEVSAEADIRINEWVKGAVWTDLDNNGWPDLYVSCHGAENLLFRNEGVDEAGRVRFTEIAQQVGVEQPLKSFPVAAFDFDNNGFQDLFVADYEFAELELTSEYLDRVPPQHPPRLYLNHGDWRFTEVSAAVGLDRSVFAMGLNYGDLNNDGFLDLYAATGNPDPRALFPNLCFLNDRGTTFLDVTASGGLGHLQKGHAVAFGDVDLDGDQDLYVNVGGFFENDFFWNAFFENPGSSHHWVALRLVGEQSNRSAIGARIQLVVSDDGTPREIHRVVSSGGSYGASSLVQEIGIGVATQIDSLTIHWPASGTTQTFQNVPADQRYLITESSAAPIVEQLPGGDWQLETMEPRRHEHSDHKH